MLGLLQTRIMNREVNLVLALSTLLLGGRLKAQTNKLSVEFNPIKATYSIVEHLITALRTLYVYSGSHHYQSALGSEKAQSNY